MNILVCISQVPDTTTKISVAPDGKSMDATGVKFILNPYDEFAIEEGLRLREKHTGTVTALTVGGDNAKEILRTALAMGADKAVIIKDAAKADSFTIAKSIADYASSINPDIILLGRQSIDHDSFQMASTLGGLLSIPSISVVSKLEITGTVVSAERDVEGGKEVLEASLPIVISAQKGLNDPRYPKLPDIMKAKQKPIEEITPAAITARVDVVAMDIPATARANKVVGDTDADIAEFVRLLHEEAKVF
ncbi:MAG: electron transfer flavoprotein subunit beta/FixA family protein [Candidatus Kapabacteria bacterium]|nr:electron transfer flavoprotein subunit beta/FixA family protein [Candidatus Kapabacteria bacterium]